MSIFLEHLESKREVREQPFHSDVPVLGGLIAAFRRLWNGVATRWYVLPMVQQQNEFNAALVEGLRMRFEELDQRLIDLDRDQVELLRTLAEVQYQVIQLRRQLEDRQKTVSPYSEEA